METGDYATNTLVVENITSVTYRLYQVTYDFKRSSHGLLQNFEKRARDAGHIISFDSRRRVLWQFLPTYTEDSNGSPQTSETPDIDALVSPGLTLTLRYTGTYEPSILAKPRSPNIVPGIHGMPGQQFSQQAIDPNTGRPVDQNSSQITSYEAYSFFVSALQTSFVSGFVARVGAIPINERTLLIPTDKCSIYESHAPTCATVVINVSMTSTGVLMVSISIRVHEGLRLLDKAIALHQDLADSPVILAPFGFLARFRSLNSGLDAASQTPYTQTSKQAADKITKRRQVISLLLRVRGIPNPVMENGPWVEVCISSASGPDLKNQNRTGPIVHWPMRLCVRRSVITYSPQTWNHGDYNALMSARDWFLQADSRAEQAARQKPEHTSTLTGIDSDSTLLQSGAPRQLLSSQQLSVPIAGQAGLGSGQTPSQALNHRPIGNAQSPSNSGLVRSGANAMYPTPPDGIQSSQMGQLVNNPDDPFLSPGITAGSVTTIITHGIPDQWPPSAGSTSSLFDPNGLGSDSILGLDHQSGHDDLNDTEMTLYDGIDGSVSSPLTIMDPNNGQMQPPPLPLQASNQASHPVNITDPSTLAMPPPSIPPIKKQDLDSDSIVFTKPELRHVRSMGDNMHSHSARNRMRTASMSQNATNRLKRGASPFGPDTVYKRLRAVLPQTSLPLHPAKIRKGSIFDKVSFDNMVPAVNIKYAQNGKFSVDRTPVQRSVSETAASLSTGYLKAHGRKRRISKTQPSNAPPLNSYPQSHLNSIGSRSAVSQVEHSSVITSPIKLTGDDGELQSDADDVSDMSDDEEVMSGDEAMSPMKSATIRRPGDESSHRGTPAREPEETENNGAMESSNFLRPPTPGWLVSKYLAEPEPLLLFPQLSGEALIAVGQLITEQAATGLVRIYTDATTADGPIPIQELHRQSAILARQAVQTLAKVFPKSLRPPGQLSLRSLIDTPDLTFIQQAQQAQAQANAQANAQQQRNMRQSAMREPEKPPMIFTIMPYHLEMRRGDSRLSVLPTAITFWESLGLGPFCGTKDIKAMCIFPDLHGLQDDVYMFLDRLKIVYESLKLGLFDKFWAPPAIQDGLISFDPERGASPNAYPYIPGNLAERIPALAESLERSPETKKNFVVFAVYWPSHPASIVEACYSFYKLSEAYYNSPNRVPGSNELVLQLIPINLMSSPSNIVIPSPQDLGRLCIETYDRCTIYDVPMPAPAIVLDEPIQRSNIEFKVSAPSESILHENSSIHVAYAKSLDGRWISVAWTDSRGLEQHTASYCVQRKGSRNPCVSWNDIANDIWQNTIELMAVWKVRWRVVITKCGPMDLSEAELWKQLAQTETKASLYIILLSVESAPSLQLLPRSVQLSSAIQTAGSYATPVGTPQASTPSELAATPRGLDGPTPTTPTASNVAPGDAAADLDGDGVLVDVAEQTWGVVLSHRLNNSVYPNRPNPAMASGYLVKRGGSRCEDPPSVLEINLVWIDGVARGVDPMFREMLKQFRGLVTLARARGVTEQWDVRPWHIAAAEKSVKTLYALL